MICSKCQTVFDQAERNSYLSEQSDYLQADMCLDCLLKKLRRKQKHLRPKLIKSIKRHEMLKAAYHKSSRQLSEINTKFKSANYEQNLILHNLNMEKQRQKKIAELAAKRTTSKSIEQSTEAAVQAMLAKLTPEQRAAVMANYANNQ